MREVSKNENLKLSLTVYKQQLLASWELIMCQQILVD